MRAILVPSKEGRTFGEAYAFGGREAFGLDVKGLAQEIVGGHSNGFQGFGDGGADCNSFTHGIFS